jgi:hypothetical protein
MRVYNSASPYVSMAYCLNYLITGTDLYLLYKTTYKYSVSLSNTVTVFSYMLILFMCVFTSERKGYI